MAPTASDLGRAADCLARRSPRAGAARGQPLPPALDPLRFGRQIGSAGRDGVGRGAQQARHAPQRSLHVERGRVSPSRSSGPYRAGAEQGRQPPRTFQDDRGPLLLEEPGVADEVDHIAHPLFHPNQNSPARQRRTVPRGCGARSDCLFSWKRYSNPAHPCRQSPVCRSVMPRWKWAEMQWGSMSRARAKQPEPRPSGPGPETSSPGWRGFRRFAAASARLAPGIARPRQTSAFKRHLAQVAQRRGMPGFNRTAWRSRTRLRPRAPPAAVPVPNG